MLGMKHPSIDLGLVCSDFEEALRFYRDKLGLEVVEEFDIPEEVAIGARLAPRSFRQVRLRAGQTLIKLMEIEDPPPPGSFDFQAGIRWLTFVVEDVPALVRQLKEKGVEFMTPAVSSPTARHLVCAKAPDGVLIELVQLHDDE